MSSVNLAVTDVLKNGHRRKLKATENFILRFDDLVLHKPKHIRPLLLGTARFELRVDYVKS